MSLERFQERRALVIGVLICIPLLLLIARLYHIQIVSSAELKQKAQKQYMMSIVDLAPRGDIVCMSDNARVVLATSEMRKTLSVNPRQIVNDRDELAATLADILGMDKDTILDELNDVTTPDGKPNYYVRIKRSLTNEEADKIQRLDVPGLALKDEPRRAYVPQAKIFANIMGVVGYDDDNFQNKGLEGLELFYDDILHGESGERDIPVDALGHPLNIDGYKEVPPKKGCNLLLTINPQIQQIVEEELKAAYDQWHPVSATAIAMDPYTGDVLAIANFPAFDPDNPGASPPDARQNRAIMACYEPGSTFKPLVGVFALQNGIVTPDTNIKCFGPVCGRELGDHVSGWLTYRDVIVRSSNRGAAQVGVMMDEKGLLRPSVLKYGFGKPTGIDLPGEIGGIMTPASQWTRQSSAVSVAFGQEIAVTPLQLIRGFCVIANGGYLVRPRIVKNILDDNGDVIHDLAAITKDRNFSKEAIDKITRIVKPEQPQRIADAEAVKTMQGILPLVVSDPSGTGYRSRLKEYTMAGKTGTAQKMVGGLMSHQKFVGYFVGYAPVSNPKVVILVAINEPKGAYYGGTVAAPACSKMILRSLKSMGVPEEAPAENPAPAPTHPR